MKKFVKAGVIGLGALVLSTLGIFASDALQGIDGGIDNLAGARKAGICMQGALPLRTDAGIVCIDMYEASPGKDCPHQNPQSGIQTEENAREPKCYPSTVAGGTPWTYISLPQAERMCAQAGKRLPSAEEWYAYTLGTNGESCTISAKGVQPTGNATCVSSLGIYDAIGNAWEWVDEIVIDGTYDGRKLPEEGYVTSVDADGVGITTDKSPDEMYGADYMWSKEEGVLGMIRGGFYSSGKDAGLYTVNASLPTSVATQGIGFRCVEDVL